MKYIRIFISLMAVTLFLALAATAMARNAWYVDGVNGNDNNDCKTSQTACKTIGHAISLASHWDSVMVAAATYKENLSIGFSLKVIGSGASTTIIDGGGVNTVVYIPKRNPHVILSKLTIQNGRRYPNGGGILNRGTLTINNSTISGNRAVDVGGGILNRGTLTINNSTISGNSAETDGGGIYNYDYGTLTINNSTISSNSALHDGGGIYNNSGGALTINNSTIGGNSAQFDGGGIYNFEGPLTINNSTISGNRSWQGGGVYKDGDTATINNSTISGNSAEYVGGGIYSYYPGTLALQNSIVANSISGGNCSGTLTSNGYNLSSDDTCNFTGPGDMNNTDPKLGKLWNNGGPTQTIRLLPASPAIDAGNPNGCTDGNGKLLKTDQRGYPRPDPEDNGVGCDIGAFERQKN